MRLNAKLAFNGNCREAFSLYEQCLHAKITFIQTYGVSQPDVRPEMRDKIVHATLQAADGVLTGADVPSTEYVKPQGFSLQLNVAGNQDVQRVYDALSEGGVIHLPLQKTFWSDRYAVVTDRFGTPWEINGT